MASSKVVREGLKQVKPILSTNRTEARRRVLNLYKAWYKQIPFVVKEYDIPILIEDGREKLRERFSANKHVTDVRAIDMLVIKGQMELAETLQFFKQRSHVMTFFHDTVEEKPKDFLTKFYDGHE